MGWNSTLVVLHDALGQIETDPNFGKNVAHAIKEIAVRDRGTLRHVHVAAGNHANAAMVVESHHADTCAVVTVAGNLGICQVMTTDWRHDTPAGAERALKAWADELGFDLTPKAGRRL